MLVVDLGAAPGSWSQIAAQKVGKHGKVLALDILPMDPLPGVDFLQGDFREASVLREFEAMLEGRQVDLVISDIAPNMAGNAMMDMPRSIYLIELALDFAQHHLKPGGNYLVKAFQGTGYPEYMTLLRKSFDQVFTRKPKASRDRSNEIYLLGKGKLENYTAVFPDDDTTSMEY
ncbi:23S rRNA (uridine2552-2'-O)-methyltransferase [Chitinivorax tropicus]|uniref:Ribosomal RNA large subunit methyltransferase E n=2 Tax=Chitinivorax tropicus TaxID=714531 RepID=A0A840MR05_9PROT|nr:23S rRNA (uridine2552-2'-O)-methyltransferase [Chitinivorax tropicus]